MPVHKSTEYHQTRSKVLAGQSGFMSIRTEKGKDGDKEKVFGPAAGVQPKTVGVARVIAARPVTSSSAMINAKLTLLTAFEALGVNSLVLIR